MKNCIHAQLFKCSTQLHKFKQLLKTSNQKSNSPESSLSAGKIARLRSIGSSAFENRRFRPNGNFLAPKRPKRLRLSRSSRKKPRKSPKL